MFKLHSKNNFEKTTKYLNKIQHGVTIKDLAKYGEEGVRALSSATPVDSGLTASSWYYAITEGPGYVEINFRNSNIQNGVPIAVIIQYGHGTGTGGWVKGRDYINPAIRPIFDRIAKEAWEGVVYNSQ